MIKQQAAQVATEELPTIMITDNPIMHTLMKKMLCTLALLSIVGTSLAQKYQLSGKAPEGVKTVYYRNLEGNTTDSVKVDANGAFSLAGDAAKKPFVMFATEKQFQRPALAVLDGDVNLDLPTMTVSGTTENHLLNAVQQQLLPLADEITKMAPGLRAMQQAGKTDSPEFKQQAEVYDGKVDQIANLVKKSEKEHPEALYNAPLLRLYIGLLNEDDIKEMIAAKPAFFDTELLKPIAQELTKQAELDALHAPGKPFIDFKMPNPEGVMKSLSSYVTKNKLTLVDFWASWCGPCRREMPHVKELYAKYKSKGLEIVGVSFDQDKEAWKGAIKQMQLKWPQMSDLKGWQSQAGQLYGIRSIPATLLVNQKGEIVAFGLRGAELEAKVAELLP